MSRERPTQHTKIVSGEAVRSSSHPPSSVPNYVALIVALIALAGQVWSSYWQSEANKTAAELNFRSSERASDIRMIEVAVGVLRAPISEDVAQIRKWAMDTIDLGSKRKFTPDERAALLRRPLPSAQGRISTLLDFTPNPCAVFRRNQDGSWTQTGRIVLPGNNTFEGTTFKNTVEARLLDQLCGTGP